MKDTEAWTRMSFLLTRFCRSKQLLIQDAYAIYNPSLVASFITQLCVLYFLCEKFTIKANHSKQNDLRSIFILRKDIYAGWRSYVAQF